MDILERIADKDHKKAYDYARELCAKSAASDEYYRYFDDFANLLGSANSYVRTRGFLLCCAQARWDEEGRISAKLPELFRLLHDEKPTVVRQCLAALHEVAVFRPELSERIDSELRTVDTSKYKDSMAPLIRKDIAELAEML